MEKKKFDNFFDTFVKLVTQKSVPWQQYQFTNNEGRILRKKKESLLFVRQRRGQGE
jgi:hypothetical protein